MATKLAKKYSAFKNTAEMREAFEKIGSRWSEESWLNTRMLLWFCEQVEGAPKPKRKSTAWNKFFASGIRSGKIAAQVAKEWRERK